MKENEQTTPAPLNQDATGQESQGPQPQEQPSGSPHSTGISFGLLGGMLVSTLLPVPYLPLCLLIGMLTGIGVCAHRKGR